MKKVFHRRNLIKMHQKNIRNTQSKVNKNARKVHVYMWLHTSSVKSTIGNKTRFFLSPFYVSTGSRLALVGAFRSDDVAACSTALRSTTEDNESAGYVTAPGPSKMKQHSSTADWLNF